MVASQHGKAKSNRVGRTTGCIVVDIVTAYGADSIAGVIYVGGAIVALHYNPPCVHPVIKDLFPIFISQVADDMTSGAELFVDSCVKEPLPFEVKLLWMGGFIAQPVAARLWNVTRKQDPTKWEHSARQLPVLVVQGKEDLHCLYEPMIGIAKRVYEDVEVKLMDGVGHSPHFERAEETNRCITDWVNKVVNKNSVCQSVLPRS